MSRFRTWTARWLSFGTVSVCPSEFSDADFGYAEFDTPGAGFAVARDPERAGRHTGIGFAVEDLDAAHAQLSAVGVEFTRPPTREPWGGYMAIFADPDGNTFYPGSGSSGLIVSRAKLSTVDPGHRGHEARSPVATIGEEPVLVERAGASIDKSSFYARCLEPACSIRRQVEPATCPQLRSVRTCTHAIRPSTAALSYTSSSDLVASTADARDRATLADRSLRPAVRRSVASMTPPTAPRQPQ